MRARNDIREYRRRYGTRGTLLVVQEFIRRCPEFPGKDEIAGQLGGMMLELERALKQAHVRFDQ